MMKNTLIVFLSALLVGALPVLSGCGKSGEKAAEKQIEKSLKESGAKDAKVDISKGSMKIKTDEGEMELNTGDSASLPADFPKDVSTIKGAKILMAMTSPQGLMIQMHVAGEKGRIAASYSDEMISKGWKQEVSVDMDDASSRSFKKDKRQVSLVASKSSDGCDVMLTVTTEQ